MTAYVELIIIDNLVLTYLLASLSYRVNQMRAKRLRCLAASIIGTAVALAYPFVRSTAWLWVIRILLWAALSLILFFKTRRFKRGALTFLTLTFLFGGATFALNFFVTGSVSAALTQNALKVPFSVLFAATLFCVYITKRLFLKLQKSRDAASSIMRITMVLLGKRYDLNALMDTGNRLYDDKTGLPVIFVSARALLQRADEKEFVALTTGRGESLQRDARYLRLSTVAGGVNSILLLKPDEFALYSDNGKHILYEVMIGVSFSPMRDSVDYDAVLHPSLK